MPSAPGAPNTGFRLTSDPPPLRALLRDIWGSRELIRMLARQDFFVRYRRESFGFVWAVGLPVMQASVLAVVFSRVIKIHTGTNFPTFVFAGILPWAFFAATISNTATSIVDGQALATKIYFPRAVLPQVGVASTLYGFIPSVGVLVAMAAIFGVPLGAPVLYLLPAVAMLVLLCCAFGLVLSALHVYFRDVRYIVSAALFAWFYATPVLYPLRLAPGALHTVLKVNPATGAVELFRAAIGAADPGWEVTVAFSCAWLVVLLAIAAIVHQRLDRRFIDPL